MKSLLLTILAVLTISSNAYAALGQASQHCPFNANFHGVIIQPVQNNTIYLVQCLNKNGSSYFSENADTMGLTSGSVWLKHDYPKAWICYGNDPEDCPIIQG